MFGLFKKKKETSSCGCESSSCCTPKVEEEKVPCDCGGMCTPSEIAAKKAAEASSDTGVLVKVLGSGCKKCNDLEEATVKALEELGMDTHVEHVTDFSEIAKYGVMSTPALVYRNKVLSFGKVLKTSEVKALLEKERN